MLSTPRVNLALYVAGAICSAAALIDTLWIASYAQALGTLGATLFALGRWDRVFSHSQVGPVPAELLVVPPALPQPQETAPRKPRRSRRDHPATP